MKRVLLLITLLLCSVLFYGQTYSDLFESANKTVEEGKLKEAESLYTKIITDFPSNTRNALVFANLADVQRRLGKPNDALISYEKALQLLPTHEVLRLERGILLIEVSRFTEAYNSFTSILENNEKNEKALLLRAYVSMLQSKLEDAEEEYLKLLKVNPTHLTGRVGLALVYQKEKRYQEALTLANGLLVENNNNPELLLFRSGIYLDMGMLDFAMLDASDALSYEESWEGFLQKGKVLLAEGKKQLAELSFNQALTKGAPRIEVQELLMECK